MNKRYMKVNIQKVSLFRDSYRGGTDSISRYGRPQCSVKSSESSLLIITNNKKEIIHVINENLLINSHPEYGTSSFREYSPACVYFPKDMLDYNNILQELRKGKLPDEGLYDTFMTNYYKDVYNNDNNWPMSIFVSNDLDSIKEAMSKNKIAIGFEYYDCFVHSDNLLTCPNEDLPNVVFITNKDLLKLFDDSTRQKFLWKITEINKNYNVLAKSGENLLTVDNLKNVIKEAFDRLWISNNKINIQETIAIAKNGINVQKEILKQRDIEAIENNKKFLEKQKATGEIWDENTAVRTILQDLKSFGINQVKLNDNTVEYEFKK